MPDGTPVRYEDDVYLWSREQAELLRRLAESRRDLPNALDLPNIIEEIETVGRSDLRAVQSNLAEAMAHLIRLGSSPEARPARKWKAEIAAQLVRAHRHFTPGMRQDVGLQEVWRDAVIQAGRQLAAFDEPIAPLPAACPFTLDELLNLEATVDDLVARLASASRAAAEGGA